MKRLTLFLKGNVDVHDSLHSCRLAGKLAWNGMNEVLRQRHPRWLARMKHETWSRSDALLAATGTVPEALVRRSLPMGAYSVESQFSRAIFEAQADAYVLSLQPDLTTRCHRHKRDGYLLYTAERKDWSDEDRQWLQTEFETIGYLDVVQCMANFQAIIRLLRERGDAPILIYNMSPIMPGEAIHCHQGMGETLSTRIRRFNLGLIELSEATGVSIIDLDTVVARHGADALKLDGLHLTAEGYRLVAEEVVRVLADLGLLEPEVG